MKATMGLNLVVIALMWIAVPPVASAETSPFVQGTESEMELGDFTRTIFTGVMEDGEPIIVSLDRTGDLLAGDIFFEAQNIRMGLRGTCDSSGAFKMDGSLASNRLPEMDNPPTFGGTIAASALTLEGTMHHGPTIPPFSRKSTGFSAEQAAFGIRHEVVRHYGSNELSYTLSYPSLVFHYEHRQFRKAANRAVLSLVHEEAIHFWGEPPPTPPGISMKDIPPIEWMPCKPVWGVPGYGITALTESLVSVSFYFYYFNCGAHWNEHFNATTLVADEDGARAIGIEELFRPDADFWPIIEKSCIEDLESQGAASASNAFLYVDREDVVWTISRGGLSFWFPKGLASGRSDGAYVARIPFSVLSELLKPGMPDALFDGK